jgi:hypothetical protein
MATISEVEQMHAKEIQDFIEDGEKKVEFYRAKMEQMKQALSPYYHVRNLRITTRFGRAKWDADIASMS